MLGAPKKEFIISCVLCYACVNDSSRKNGQLRRISYNRKQSNCSSKRNNKLEKVKSPSLADQIYKDF